MPFLNEPMNWPEALKELQHGETLARTSEMETTEFELGGMAVIQRAREAIKLQPATDYMGKPTEVIVGCNSHSYVTISNADRAANDWVVV